MPSGQLFIKVHNGFPEHRKTGDLSDRAFRNLIELWCYCSRNLTDGKVSKAQSKKILTPKSFQELVEAGFIVDRGVEIEMHDYLDHQQSAQEVSDLRKRRAEAGKRGGKAKANGLASASPVAKQTPSKTLADTDTDTDTDKKNPRAARPSSPGLELATTGPTAQTLVAEWLDNCPQPPPGRVKGQVAKEIKQMLSEGIDYDRVRLGLAEWNTKDVHPSVLASIVHGIGNRQTRSKGQAATDDLFGRALERAAVRDGA